MKRAFLSCILTSILFFASIDDAFSAGKAGAAFLKLGIGARNVAMGGTGATETDATAVYWNPAGIMRTGRRQFSLMHASWLSGINFENLSFSQRLTDSAFGILATYLTVPAIDRYDNTGIKQAGTYAPTDLVVGLSYARAIEDIPFGATLKYVSSQLDDRSANAVALDVGVLLADVFPWQPTSLTFGAALQNIGTPMKFNLEESPLPFNVKAGLRYQPKTPIALQFDLNQGLDTDLVANAGAEYVYAFSGAASLAGRLGYHTNVKGLNGFAGLTAGIGVGLGSLIFDYAFEPFGDLDDDTHRVTLRYGF